MSNREIADKLFVSENTVKTHSSRLLDKKKLLARPERKPSPESVNIAV